MQITFGQLEEAVFFCQQAQLCKNCYQYVKQQQKRQHFVLQIREDFDIDKITKALQEVFNQFRLPQIIQQLIHKVYYFDKYEEVKEIYNYSIEELTNNHLTEKFFPENKMFSEVVYILFKREVCSQRVLSFNRLVFRLMEIIRPFLIDLIGLAIEERKNDIQHEYFLRSVTHFISWQAFQTNTLHIVHENEFLYFKENGEKYHHEELINAIKDSLIYSIGLTNTEWNLSPIIALAPKLIYIYTDDQTDTYLLIVKRLFRERLFFLPKKLFPFYKMNEK